MMADDRLLLESLCLSVFGITFEEFINVTLDVDDPAECLQRIHALREGENNG